MMVAVVRNDARFLWKRIAPAVKQESETLRKAWDIGKALWQRYDTALRLEDLFDCCC